MSFWKCDFYLYVNSAYKNELQSGFKQNMVALMQPLLLSQL